MIDVIICDDHPIVRQGLARIIEENLDVGSVREADNGQMLMDLSVSGPATWCCSTSGCPDGAGSTCCGS